MRRARCVQQIDERHVCIVSGSQQLLARTFPASFGHHQQTGGCTVTRVAFTPQPIPLTEIAGSTQNALDDISDRTYERIRSHQQSEEYPQTRLDRLGPVGDQHITRIARDERAERTADDERNQHSECEAFHCVSSRSSSRESAPRAASRSNRNEPETSGRVAPSSILPRSSSSSRNRRTASLSGSKC